MNIIVCIKQVPDTTDVKIDQKTGTLIREGVPSIVNPDDKHAVEEALKLREKFGGSVTALSMGPPQAEDALREVSAMGVDEMILLSDRSFAGADTWATSYTLGEAVKKIGFDLVICGREAIDGDTAQIGPQLAEHLRVPQITYVRKVEVGDGKILC
ncbi:MAG: electron transfer flavoprotein subunit beta/FixA family protein, partial [Thermoplasmata archaeon]|nr:electron transfer flavoprotein subunit beta/FixA family protein [Thermoplasmata archaeon]